MRDAEDILRLLKPDAPRFTASYWEACKMWGVYFFDGGTELVGAMAETMQGAFQKCFELAQVKAALAAFDAGEPPPPPPPKEEDLF